MRRASLSRLHRIYRPATPPMAEACRCNLRRQQPSRSLRVSLVVVNGDRVDEILIFLGVGALGSGKRLPVRLGREGWGTDIGNPDLDGAKPLLPKTLPVLADTVLRRSR